MNDDNQEGISCIRMLHEKTGILRKKFYAYTKVEFLGLVFLLLFDSCVSKSRFYWAL